MGCDGGTIPRRDELVRMKKKPEQKDKEAERSFKWRNCALTQQPLQEPIVGCGLGRLYTKSSVIEALLDKETKPGSIDHIKSLKDIKDLKLSKNPAYIATERVGGAVDEGSSPYICPISGIEMTGKFRFVFKWSCGCVLAERTLKEVKQNLCLMCQQPFTDNDVIVLNGIDEDVEILQEKMAIRIASRKNGKKSKSSKTQAGPSSTITNGTNIDDHSSQPSTSDIKTEVETIPLAIPKKSLPGSSKRPSNDLVKDPSYKKTKQDYSIAKDPKSSEVYKSLFTSHKNDQSQERAHWITYNPFYN